MEQLDTTLSDIVAETAEALKSAYTTYGTDAVDLTLSVYRIGALQEVIPSLMSLITSLILLIVLAKKLWPWVIEEDTDGGYTFAVFTTAASVFFAATSLGGTLDFYAWAAIFGYPEIYIAAKALSAIGAL